MKRLKIGFLVDPFATINPAYDTSFALMQECVRRGHAVRCCELNDLIAHHNTVEARLTPCQPDPLRGLKTIGPARQTPLSKMDAFFIRKDPPFDMRYVSALYLLDRLNRSGAGKRPFFVNDPAGILLTNEKLSVLPFEPFSPASAAGSTPEALNSFLKRPSKLGWVFKPLYYKGGRGVTWVRPRDRKNLAPTIRRLTRNGREPIVCQHYVDHATAGDKRILILDGRIVGAMRRIARKGEFRANLSKGARAAKADVTDHEQRMVKRLSPFLRERGLHFVGIDVLAGFLSEINVTSPSGVPEVNAFSGMRVEEAVLDFVEKRVARLR